MKHLALIPIALSLSGCWAANFQTPFSVEDPSIEGKKLVATGTMIDSTKKRYWLSYKNALVKGGYDIEESTSTNELEFPGFRVIGVKAEPVSDPGANYRFWKEGQVYARTLCSDFFRRIARSYAHREHARKQTNIVGGLVTGAMGLAGASSDVVGGTGLAFASAESGFNAYNESFMVTPDLGLMEALVKTMQKVKSQDVDVNSGKHLMYVSDVVTHLNEYVYPCTFTGMQALLDQSLNRKMSDYPLSMPNEFKTRPDVAVDDR